jgi:hypothetical protein
LEILEKKDSIIYGSLFNVLDDKNKFTSGYITNNEGGFNDTITNIGDKLSNIEMSLEFTNHKFMNIIHELFNSNDKLQHIPAILPISIKNFQTLSTYISGGYDCYNF